MKDESLSAEIGQQSYALEVLFIDYMRELYRADKPRDPVALRAKA